MEMPTQEQAIVSNREAWNDSARYHKDTREWLEMLSTVGQRDFSCLDATLTGVLEQVGVDGKDVVQPGCNNGRESLSLYALGARSVVGVDQSAAFLDQARELASRSPHQPEFIEADIHHLPTSLHQRFDVALITIGVLNWMPDIGEFMRHVAQTLKPGGALVVYETHPFLEMFDPESADPYRPDSSYFRSEPFVQNQPSDLPNDPAARRDQFQGHELLSGPYQNEVSHPERRPCTGFLAPYPSPWLFVSFHVLLPHSR
jgi:SAM-dependent methyltransferase